MTETTVIRLRKNEERRLKAGHLWVYANEIDTRQTPLKELPPAIPRCEIYPPALPVWWKIAGASRWAGPCSALIH